MATPKRDLFSAPKQSKQDVVPWGPWMALGAGFAAYLVPQFLVGAVIAVVVMATGATASDLFNDDDPNHLLNFGISLSVSLLGAWIVYEFMRRRKGKLLHLGLIKAKLMDSLLSVPVYIFGYLPAIVIAFEMVSVLLPSINLDQDQQVGFEGAQGSGQVLAFFTLVILAPLFEELLFRGLIFKTLATQWSFWKGAIVTSVLFGLVHGQLNVAIDTFILSLFACALVWHTKSIVPAILLHSIKNLVAYILLFVVG